MSTCPVCGSTNICRTDITIVIHSKDRRGHKVTDTRNVWACGNPRCLAEWIVNFGKAQITRQSKKKEQGNE